MILEFIIWTQVLGLLLCIPVIWFRYPMTSGRIVRLDLSDVYTGELIQLVRIRGIPIIRDMDMSPYASIAFAYESLGEHTPDTDTRTREAFAEIKHYAEKQIQILRELEENGVPVNSVWESTPSGTYHVKHEPAEEENKCEVCGNYPADHHQEPLYGYHRKRFFSVKKNICHVCADGLFSCWNSMNSVANRFRLMGHKLDESSLEAAKKHFTYDIPKGGLETTFRLHLRRVAHLIGLKKEDFP